MTNNGLTYAQSTIATDLLRYGHTEEEARDAVIAYSAATALGHPQYSAITMMTEHSPVTRAQFTTALHAL